MTARRARFRLSRPGLVVAGLLLIIGGFATIRFLGDRATLAAHEHLMLDRASDNAALTVRFYGVSTVLIDDGETAILTDGFFSRPGLMRVAFTPIAPDEARIRRTLADAGFDRLAAVIPLHTHYDHALDSAVVARLSGADLVGSASAANIGRGEGLPEHRLRVASGRESHAFGRFSVTLVPTRHIDHGLATGAIVSPLKPPAHALAYREGQNFTVIVAHPAGRILISGGGFLPGTLDNEEVDVALIGLAGSARAGPGHQTAYWAHVVRATGARRVIPVHWDDFTRPIGNGLKPLPNWIVPFDRAMDDLAARARADGIDVRLLPVGDAVDPFAGLAEAG